MTIIWPALFNLNGFCVWDLFSNLFGKEFRVGHAETALAIPEIEGSTRTLCNDESPGFGSTWRFMVCRESSGFRESLNPINPENTQPRNRGNPGPKRCARGNDIV